MKKVLITAGPIGGNLGPAFNIEGHGFIACLDENLEIYK